LLFHVPPVLLVRDSGLHFVEASLTGKGPVTILLDADAEKGRLVLITARARFDTDSFYLQIRFTFTNYSLNPLALAAKTPSFEANIR